MALSLSPTFKFAFFVLLGLTVFFAAVGIGMAVGIPNPSESQSSAEAWLFGAASSTLTAMVGMVGGKVA